MHRLLSHLPNSVMVLASAIWPTRRCRMNRRKNKRKRKRSERNFTRETQIIKIFWSKKIAKIDQLQIQWLPFKLSPLLPFPHILLLFFSIRIEIKYFRSFQIIYNFLYCCYCCYCCCGVINNKLWPTKTNSNILIKICTTFDFHNFILLLVGKK